jgi:peptidoglycan/LPS O-acetylase OafA/YrhL
MGTSFQELRASGAKRSNVREHTRAGTEIVDGLRGLAIVLVVGYHTWLFSWYTPPAPFDTIARTGYFGVELFFLISGFCLFFPYAQRALEAGKAQTNRAFAYRRFIKIVPSYLIALLVTAYVALPYFPEPQMALAPLGQHLVFLNNWFDDAFGGANSVFWSLGVEVEFYLIFPLLAAAFVWKPLPTAAAMIAVALAYRFGLAGCCLLREPIMRQVPAFLDVFGLGMLAAYAVVFVRTRYELAGHPRARLGFTAAALAALALILALLTSANAIQFQPGGREQWNLGGRTLLAFSIAILIVASCLSVRWWRAIVANPVLVFLSVLSYNLYLWHTLVELWLAHHHLPPTSFAEPHDDEAWRPWFILFGVGGSLLVSAAITYFIERPLLGTVRPQRFAFPWPTLYRRFVKAGSPRPPAEREIHT